MSEPRAVSRRASLKRLSAAGAAIVLGNAGTSSAGQDPKPPTGTQGKVAANVVDVAADRMAKGHS